MEGIVRAVLCCVVAASVRGACLASVPIHVVIMSAYPFFYLWTLLLILYLKNCSTNVFFVKHPPVGHLPACHVLCSLSHAFQAGSAPSNGYAFSSNNFQVVLFPYPSLFHPFVRGMRTWRQRPMVRARSKGKILLSHVFFPPSFPIKAELVEEGKDEV